MNILLDLIVVVIVVGSAILGWRRGFIKSVSGLISLILTLVIVSSFAQPVGVKLDDTVVRPWAVKQVVNSQEGLTVDAPVEQLDLATVNQGISDKFGVNVLGVEGTMGAATVGEYIEAVLKHIGVTVTISTAIATVGLFALAWLGMLLIGLLLKPILKLPILKQCNGLLGVAAGLVSAALILMVLAATVKLGGKPDGMFGPETVEKTYLFKHIQGMNPLTNWIIK